LAPLDVCIYKKQNAAVSGDKCTKTLALDFKTSRRHDFIINDAKLQSKIELEFATPIQASKEKKTCFTIVVYKLEYVKVILKIIFRVTSTHGYSDSSFRICKHSTENVTSKSEGYIFNKLFAFYLK